jgi:hypothetical protein
MNVRACSLRSGVPSRPHRIAAACIGALTAFAVCVDAAPGMTFQNPNDHQLGIGIPAESSPPPRNTVTVERVVARPPLWQPMAMRVLRANLNAFRYCYDRELQRFPTLAGRIALHVTIAAAGSVAAVQVTRGIAADPDLSSCALGNMRRLVFPSAESGNDRTLDVTFAFAHR